MSPLRGLLPSSVRKEYRAEWSRDWPHSNTYLAELYAEAKDKTSTTTEAREFLLTLMREADPVPASS